MDRDEQGRRAPRDDRAERGGGSRERSDGEGDDERTPDADDGGDGQRMNTSQWDEADHRVADQCGQEEEHDGVASHTA